MTGKLVATAAIVLAAAALIEGTQMIMAANETQCFTTFASRGEKLTGSAESVPDEAAVKPLIYKVDGPTSKPKSIPTLIVSDNQFEYDVPETGHYSFCLTNKSYSRNTVVFNYRVETTLNKDLSQLSTVEDANELITFAEKLLENTHVIVDRTETYSSREQLYSDIIDDMNVRIIRWSTCQLIFLIVICFCQIYYISSFFEVKSFV
ncbi:cop-coated vesicle membrane p24 [Babesia ovata]|uniref:Cop-coated vesicle membrane p24 n=1 Tax=Babesia ovata TaxID=189622 RepID=A0A2H6KGZ0_9APIC|nr:cop-coated vesicle membrane p24 [Babesia ovata]GBE62247.1 cop-coated vesicle membrane p24 [Babesia ovata]